MRQTPRTVRRRARAAVMLLAAVSLANADDAVDSMAAMEKRLSQQEQQIQELLKRIEQLEAEAGDSEAEPTAQAESEPNDSFESPDGEPEDMVGQPFEWQQLLTRDQLVSDEFPGSWPMFGSDMRMKIGGYIMADFVADFDGTRDPSQFLMRTIPVEGEPDYGGDPYVDFFAKETRFNLDIRRVVPGSVPLRGFIEGDFFTNGGNFRLRHAYITAGNFIVGQTWTTLSFLEALPYMIDFAAGDALFGGRTVQVRYQHVPNDRWKVSFALEQLQFIGIENASGLPGQATTQWPLASIRADYDYDSGLLWLGSSVGQLHWDGGANGPSDSAVQFAFVAAGRQNLGERAFATWQVSYTEGGGENVMAFTGTDANAVLTANGTLETFPSFSALVGFGYEWTPTLSSNASYAYGWLDTPDSRAPYALKRGGVGHVNLIWEPRSNGHFSTGAEFMWGQTRVQNNALGDATRLQLMAKFAF